VTDDIVVLGRGQSITEAEVDHERNLMALKARCKEKEIVLNDDKTRVFADTKREIAEATILGHDDPKFALELHVDSSHRGLGCVLLQKICQSGQAEAWHNNVAGVTQRFVFSLPLS